LAFGVYVKSVYDVTSEYVWGRGVKVVCARRGSTYKSAKRPDVDGDVPLGPEYNFWSSHLRSGDGTSAERDRSCWKINV
jgi:hypothetical protein